MQDQSLKPKILLKAKKSNPLTQVSGRLNLRKQLSDDQVSSISQITKFTTKADDRSTSPLSKLENSESFMDSEEVKSQYKARKSEFNTFDHTEPEACDGDLQLQRRLQKIDIVGFSDQSQVFKTLDSVTGKLLILKILSNIPQSEVKFYS